MGKPPLRWVRTHIELVNRRGQEMWFLIRYSADKPLPKTARFSNRGGFRQPFVGKRWKGPNGRAVMVCFLGSAGFCAFRMPAHSALSLRNLKVESDKPVTEFEVWEATALLVNGTTPLDKWLPYATRSSKDGTVDCSTDWYNLDWDPKRLASRTDYPKKQVLFVDATVRYRWVRSRNQ